MSVQQVVFGKRTLTVKEDENLLDACLRSGVEIPFSCRGGVCQACLVRSLDGEVPAHAQRSLSPALRDKGYLLACQCQPAGLLTLALPDPADLLTGCMLHDSRLEDDYLFIRLETMRELRCKAGQTLSLNLPENVALTLEITSATPDSYVIEAVAHCPPALALPDWLRDSEFGHDFEIAGPFDKAQDGPQKECAYPEPDPVLWAELDNGLKVRAILEDFYQQVYADERLMPFFTGNTMGRAIDKQYSFLQQLMTGESCYFGDRPRNAHHWMVISDDIYDHRQALMHRTQAAHGLSECQMARWARLENHFRSDMIKDKPWPRVMGGVEIPLEGFAEETLSEGSVCDYCSAIVDAGTTVRYHLRLGKISCPACSQTHAGAPA